MEAAGIEPASENVHLASATCLVSTRNLAARRVGTPSNQPAFLGFRGLAEGDPPRYPLLYDAVHLAEEARPDGALAALSSQR